MNLNLERTYQEIEQNEIRCELLNCENPDIFIVAFGLVGRIVKTVIKEAAIDGIKVCLIRPITLWPFPTMVIREIADKFKKEKDFLVVEMNHGQMVEDVELAVQGRSNVHFYGRSGGVIPTTDEIYDKVQEIVWEKRP